MGEQAEYSMIDAEIGGGQYWHENYDPYDPLSLQDAHGAIPGSLQGMIDSGDAVPVLVARGTIYPNGRILPVLLKGIDPQQTILSLPSGILDKNHEELPALIGTRMAESSGLEEGDTVTVRWRDAQGVFDARDIQVVRIMSTTVGTIDIGQVWLPLQRMQTLMGMESQASFVVVAKDSKDLPEVSSWIFRDHAYLLNDIRGMVQSKKAGASILYFVLISLAMLAIFNTQVLSIFKRRKEMGTLMAMGLTRLKVIQLFTLEGAMHGILAAFLAALYGIPLLVYFSKIGWAMPKATDSYGFALGEKLFPTYSAGLVLGTTLLVLVITTIVSFLPTRKIAKLKPTDALRGRMS
jgi:ABC-type lipoprotein release transport system permease subunit